MAKGDKKDRAEEGDDEGEKFVSEEVKGGEKEDKHFQSNMEIWRMKEFYDNIRTNYKETFLKQKMLLKKTIIK